MFDTLPPELVLRILAFLDVQDVHTCQLVSPTWNHLVKLNESVVYRAVAIRHGFVIESHSSLEEAKSANPGGWMASATTWKDLCQRFFMLDRNWHARGESYAPRDRLYKTSRGIHRFKLDEKYRLVIATFTKGGLKVFCMDSDELLFELPKTHVKSMAHCEYENGYLIFDRYQAMEVWKFDFAPEPTSDSPSDSPPDQRQTKAYKDALVSFPSTSRRGILQPHALLVPPRPCRAYRFVYPTLLIGSHSGQRAFLYNIPNVALEETIPFPTRDPSGYGVHAHVVDHEAFPIHYVELGPRHVFVCSENDIFILARNHDDVAADRRLLKFPSSGPDDPKRKPAYGLVSIARSHAYQISLSSYQPAAGFIEERSLSPFVQRESSALVPLRDSHHNFCAVHVSPTGKSFAAITWTGLLFLVKDFERTLPGEDGSAPEKCFDDADVTLAIDMRGPLTNLTFGDDGQIIVHSFTAFHIVLWPESAPSAPRTYPSSLTGSPRSTLPAAFSDVRIFVHPRFTQHDSLPLVSCLKVTRTAIWLDWSARALADYWRHVPLLVDPEMVLENDEGLEDGEREQDFQTIMSEDRAEAINVAQLHHLDDEEEEEEEEEEEVDHEWNEEGNPFTKRSLCRVDFSPRCF